MIKLLILLLAFGYTSLSMAQFIDDFNDGDFTNNPTWFGEDSVFIVNVNNELQLDAYPITADAFLVTESGAIENAVWEFQVMMDFNPSGTNYCQVYLASNTPNLKGNLDGYYVYIGGTNDEISLFRQDGAQTEKIITGVADAVNMAAVNTYIRVTRDAVGNWELERDTTGNNTAYISEGTVFDDTYVQTFYFGVYCDYTQTRSDKFFFDNFTVTGDAFFDPNPPVLLSATPTSQTTVAVQFDKVVTELSAENIANYDLNNGIGNPTLANRDASDFTVVNLTFADPFVIGVVYTLTTQNIEDLSGNVSGMQTTTVQYVEAQTPDFGDIIINEFMADETPVVGLPETQFVELYNRSNKYFHLNGWKLSDNNSTGTIQDDWLYPGEYLILVPTSGLTDYPQAINVTSWASLNNSGDDIILETDGGILVDKLTYTDDWYQDPNKDDGGWSIERINPDLPCSDANNWRASTNPNGGTPGVVNSVLDNTPDTSDPLLIGAQAANPNFLTLTFNEGMDSLNLANVVFNSTPSLTIDQRIINATYPKNLTLQFNENLTPGLVYSFELIGFEDCSGNQNSFEGTFVLPQQAEGDEIIINEILFNPLTSGSDFVELYNRSDKYIDLINWELAKYADDTISSNKVIDVNYILAPDDYVVITKDSNFQIANYPFAKPGKFIQLSSLPSYNNDSSTVYLIFFNQVIDKVAYSSDWHFTLLQSDKGVSLERFDAFEPSNDENNWHSASETVGFATPGIKNSQATSPNSGGTISLSSNSFSPDNDGFQDVLLITYEVDQPTMLGDLVVYDDMGRKVRTLFTSHLLGERGVIKWDGLRDDDNKASIGPYIILFEALNTDTGEKLAIRKVVTLAGKL